MKRKYFSGKTGLISTIRIGCTAAVCMLPIHAFAGSTEAPEPAAEEPELPSNWVDFTVGGAAIGGDEGAYARSVGRNGDFYGGISSMHWEQEANDITWTLDGHALFGSEDYEIILGAEKMDLGYVEAGYREFRTWYDGSGGYLPIPDGWLPIQDDELSVDRGEIWFEAGLRMEDLPEITFRYTHGWRDGEKDSTMWGRGIGDSSSFGIVPSLNKIDETRDTFELDIADTFGNTDIDLGLIYEIVSNSDTREMSNLGGDSTTTQKDAYDSDLFNGHISSVSRLNDRMMLSFGYSFTTVDTDTDGSSRISDPLAGHDWFDLVGGGEYQSNIVNANFWWNPIDDLVIVPSLRAEWENQSAVADFTEIPRGGDSTDMNRWEELKDKSDSDWDTYTEQIDARYNGIENILLYAKAVFSQTDGDVDYKSYVEDVFDGGRKKSVDINQWQASIGANWYPLSCLNFSTEYYHRDFDADYQNKLDGYDSHIASQDISTDDFNIRMTWRALSNLTLVTRYDYQRSFYDTQGIDGDDQTLSSIQSADVNRNIISQSITWMPIEQAYVQGTVSWVMAETDTPASDQAPAGVTDSDNDYVTANLTIGYALDKKTDLTFGYSYYYSSNFDIPYAAPGDPGSVGYGTSLEEHVFSVSLNRQINRNMIWNLGYGYYNSNDGTSGGNNNFTANMVSTGLQIRF